MLVPAKNANAHFEVSLVLKKTESATFNLRLRSRNVLLFMAERNKLDFQQGVELPRYGCQRVLLAQTEKILRA